MHVNFFQFRNNFINKLEFTDTKNIRSNTARFLKRKNKI
jgi:hypothetical protein